MLKDYKNMSILINLDSLYQNKLTQAHGQEVRKFFSQNKKIILLEMRMTKKIKLLDFLKIN